MWSIEDESWAEEGEFVGARFLGIIGVQMFKLQLRLVNYSR